MRKYMAIVLLLIAVPASGAGRDEGNDVGQAIKGLTEAISEKQIQRVDILSIPRDVLTGIRVTPEVIEEHFTYRFTIQDLRASTYQTEMLGVLRDVKLSTKTDAGDIRWAMLFYNTNGKRVAGVYLDRGGLIGAVNGQPIGFNGVVYRWLTRRFDAVFKS